MGQIAAEALGIATDDVHVVSADTDTTPMDTGAIASRTTYVTGNAIIQAAEQAREIRFEAAAPMLNFKPEQLEARDRKIQVLGFPQQYKTIGEVAHHSEIVIGRPAIGSGSYNPPTVEMDPALTFTQPRLLMGKWTMKLEKSKSYASSPPTIAVLPSTRCWWKARFRVVFRWASASHCKRRSYSRMANR